LSYSFACPRCGKKLVANASMVGQERVCPNPECRAKLRVPAEGAKTVEAGAKTEGASEHGLLLLPHRKKGHEDLIDMTAMVDIVFFLLIFFMVTSIQALESVIELPAPQAASSTPSIAAADPANDPSVVFVTIEADDTVWVDEERVYGDQDLRVKLRKLRDDGMESIFIMGHPEASHGMLVMVLDAGTDAGMGDVRFSVSENLELPEG
jgi:biopolymer transport protein ExbD